MPFGALHTGSNEGADIASQQYGVGHGTPIVTIHWSGTGPVQYGFRVNWAVLEEMARMRAAGQFGNDDEYMFYTAPVSRQELNEGIKQIRRARDAVFEADA